MNNHISKTELFLGFSRIALSGFGGVLPFARRVIVEERGWLTSDEFTSLLGLCQFLPGPNVVNLSVCIGSRFQGWRGSMAAFCGILLPPFVIIILLGILYDRFGSLPAISSMLRGISAVAAGLILSTGLKMAADLRKRPLLLVCSMLVLAGLLIFHLPLPLVTLCLAPLSMLVVHRFYGEAK